ncbi:MAG: hypothetical protein ACLVLH_27045 [Eisenbergiella massiliensis]
MTIILAGQLVVVCLRPGGFAAYRFRGKAFLPYICAYAAAFQVTMLSQYLVLDR